MNVFLVGGESRFLDAMINKLNKNGHHVYWLTGCPDSRTAYQRVFERYDFVYESDSIHEILTSIHPDIVFFLGAQDTVFDWRDPRRESVHFTASLMNVLSVYSMQKKGRFIYLSSQEIYGNSYAEDIPEDAPASAKDFRALAIAQGEEICKSYQKQEGLECIIARLDHLYGAPDPGALWNEPCAALAVEMLRSNSIQASSQHQIAMLHQNDAVEYLYCLMKAPKLEHNSYNLSSGQPITLYQLAEELAAGRSGVTVQDTTVGGSYRCILSPQRFLQEFDAKIFVPYKEGVAKELRLIQKNQKAFLNIGKQPETLGSTWRQHVVEIIRLLVPYLETAFFALPACWLNGFSMRNEMFSGLDIYLLYILLIAIVHGQQAAVLAAVLASVGYLVQQVQYTEAAFSGLLNYNSYIWMVQIFIVGMAVGYLKDQIQAVRIDSDNEIQYLKKQLNELETINNSNVRMKQNFEQQIVNQRDSLGKIYEITAELEQKSPEEVLFYAAQVLKELMDTQDVAVYTVANRDYARLFSFTSPVAKQMGNSICYSKMTDLERDLENHRVFINRKLDKQYPMMACGIYTEESLQLIVMLWGVPWERMTLAEENRLTVVSYLIQNSVLRSRNYLNALQEQRYIKGTNVLQEQAFRQLATAFIHAKSNGLTECALLTLPGTSPDDRTALSSLDKLIRQSDYIGVVGQRLYVLLCNTDNVSSDIVRERLQQAGFEVEHGKQENVMLE